VNYPLGRVQNLRDQQDAIPVATRGSLRRADLGLTHLELDKRTGLPS